MAGVSTGALQETGTGPPSISLVCHPEHTFLRFQNEGVQAASNTAPKPAITEGFDTATSTRLITEGRAWQN